MNVLVMVEDHPGHSRVLAHVHSVPSPFESNGGVRDVVTMFGSPTPESLALALAAAVEGQCSRGAMHAGAVRQLGVRAEQGAMGDAAWRDARTGELVSEDLDISMATLEATAARLLGEGGQMLRRVVGGLCMPDWPEGARRAISVSLGPVHQATTVTRARLEGVLESLREADALAFEYEGD